MISGRRTLYEDNPTAYRVAGYFPLIPALAAPMITGPLSDQASQTNALHERLFRTAGVNVDKIEDELQRKARIFGAKYDLPSHWASPGQKRIYAVGLGEESMYDPIQRRIYRASADPVSAVAHELGHHVDFTRKGRALGFAKRNLMKGLAVPVALDVVGLYAPLTTGERDAVFGTSLATMGGIMAARYQMERRANEYGTRFLNQALKRQGSPLRFDPSRFKGWIGTYAKTLPLQAAALSAGLGYFGYRGGQELGLWGKSPQ